MAKKRKSRLQKTESRKALQTTFFYIVLTIGLFYFLLQYGTTAISAFTNFVVNIGRAPEERITIGGPPPAPPEVETLPRYSNEDRVRVVGTTKPGYSVEIFINEDKKEVIADAGGEFTTSANLNKEIENVIYAQVTDNSGKTSSESEKQYVIYDNEPPKLEIINPASDSQFYGERDRNKTIEGQTDPEASVTINDRIAIVASDGKFNFPVRLEEGENKYLIKAKDDAGNETEIEFLIKFGL